MPYIMGLEGPNLGREGLTCLTCASGVSGPSRGGVGNLIKDHPVALGLGLVAGLYLAYTGWAPASSASWGQAQMRQARAKLGLSGAQPRRRRRRR